MKMINHDLSTIISIYGARIKNDTILNKNELKKQKEKKQKEKKHINNLIMLPDTCDIQNIFGTFEYLES